MGFFRKLLSGKGRERLETLEIPDWKREADKETERIKRMIFENHSVPLDIYRLGEGRVMIDELTIEQVREIRSWGKNLRINADIQKRCDRPENQLNFYSCLVVSEILQLERRLRDEKWSELIRQEEFEAEDPLLIQLRNDAYGIFYPPERKVYLIEPGSPADIVADKNFQTVSSAENGLSVRIN